VGSGKVLILSATPVIATLLKIAMIKLEYDGNKTLAIMIGMLK
jgi:hypothetical protein